MRLVRGFTATPAGCVPARIVAITLFVRPRITDTVLLALLATYTVLVPGFAATAMGLPPTRMKAVTLIPPPPPWPVLPAADAGTTARPPTTASASPLIRPVPTIAAREVSLTMSPFPVQPRRSSGDRPGAAT